MTVDNFRSQNRGGKGIKGMQTIEDDYIEELLMTTTHHYLMFFTNTGRVYRLKAYEIPERPEPQEERRLSTFSSCSRERRLRCYSNRKYEKGHYLFMATKKGTGEEDAARRVRERQKKRVLLPLRSAMMMN